MERGIELVVDKGEVSQTLARVEHEATHPVRIMRAISGYLVTSTKRHIEREEGPQGKWPSLSPRTASKKIGRRVRGTENMLRVKGHLYGGLIGDASEQEAAVGSNLIYAAIQNLGGVIKMPEREQDVHLGRTNRGPRFVKAKAVRKQTRRVKVGAHTVTVPARTFLYLNDEDRSEIIDIAITELKEQAA